MLCQQHFVLCAAHALASYLQIEGCVVEHKIVSIVRERQADQFGGPYEVIKVV
jgi:hypothetical protein